MTLAQLEERVAALEQIEERLKNATLKQVEERLKNLEQVLEQLQTRGSGESDLRPCSKQEAKDEGEEDYIPGTEYDLVVTVPPDLGPRLRLRSPYREHLAQAFARYFMRVGLPHDARAFEKEGDVKP
jgi:hypothetical protein